MKRPAILIPAMGLCVALPACSSSGTEYPSLSIREFQLNHGSLAVPEGVADLNPAPLPADKSARIVVLREQLAASHALFLAEAPSARNAVRGAVGTGVGDDRWASAQVALASLDSQRSQSAVALADLDLLFVDTTLAFEQRDAVAEARATGTLLLGEEDRILAELRGMAGN